MGEFFHGWRRKLGCVALVMAGLLASGWVRSHSCFDRAHMDWPSRSERHYVGSEKGRIWWMCIPYNPPVYSVGWETEMIYRATQCDWRFDEDSWVIPYWPLAVPLTLLSAYLILWKPRKPPAKSVVDSTV